MPWQAIVVPASQLIGDLLVELGAPRSALILETESRNTWENAVNTAAIFESMAGEMASSSPRGHLPRALAAFQKVGISVTPTATDPCWALPILSFLDLLPDGWAFARTMSATR
jgi:uncharacterized SAM-binding protein YcdF (DUF218 family)